MVSTIMCSLGPDKILPHSLAIPCKGGSILDTWLALISFSWRLIITTFRDKITLALDDLPSAMDNENAFCDVCNKQGKKNMTALVYCIPCDVKFCATHQKVCALMAIDINQLSYIRNEMFFKVKWLSSPVKWEHNPLVNSKVCLWLFG
mgnify:CR=1 FL=1